MAPVVARKADPDIRLRSPPDNIVEAVAPATAVMGAPLDSDESPHAIVAVPAHVVLEPVETLIPPESPKRAVPDCKTTAPEPPTPVPSGVVIFALLHSSVLLEAADNLIDPPRLRDDIPAQSNMLPAAHVDPAAS